MAGSSFTMRIDSIRLFRMAPDDALAECGERIEPIVVRIASGDSVGFGEVDLPGGPTASEEWSAGAFACLRDWLAPAMIGKAVPSGERLQELLGPFRGNARAKSALDVAWWNLVAAAQGQPLYQALGGERNTISVACTVPVPASARQLIADVGAAFDAGFEVVVLPFRPGWEVEMVRAVRQEFPAQRLAIDCGAGCSLAQQEMFFRLEDFGLHFIEQPLADDDLVGHAMLQSSLRTPICLNASITSLARAEQAIDMGSCRMVRLDVAQVGGITPALAIREACAAAAIPCGVGGGRPSGIGTHASAAVATRCELPMVLEPGGGEVPTWDRTGQALTFETDLHGRRQIRLPDDAQQSPPVDVQDLAEAAVEQVTLEE